MVNLIFFFNVQNGLAMISNVLTFILNVFICNNGSDCIISHEAIKLFFHILLSGLLYFIINLEMAKEICIKNYFCLKNRF